MRGRHSLYARIAAKSDGPQAEILVVKYFDDGFLKKAASGRSAG